MLTQLPAPASCRSDLSFWWLCQTAKIGTLPPDASVEWSVLYSWILMRAMQQSGVGAVEAASILAYFKRRLDTFCSALENSLKSAVTQQEFPNAILTVRDDRYAGFVTVEGASWFDYRTGVVVPAPETLSVISHSFGLLPLYLSSPLPRDMQVVDAMQRVFGGPDDQNDTGSGTEAETGTAPVVDPEPVST